MLRKEDTGGHEELHPLASSYLQELAGVTTPGTKATGMLIILDDRRQKVDKTHRLPKLPPRNRK